MALRYVARRVVGFPALRRASGHRLSSTAGSGPLASRSSHQAGYYSNGEAGWMRRHEETEELLAKLRAAADAAEAAVRHADKMDKLERRVRIGSFALAFGLAVYTVYVIDRDYGWVFRQIAFNRDAYLEADIEAGMEGRLEEI